VFEAAVAESNARWHDRGIHNLVAIQRAMQIASSEEITASSAISWLAITGAVTPFIGFSEPSGNHRRIHA